MNIWKLNDYNEKKSNRQRVSFSGNSDSKKQLSNYK